MTALEALEVEKRFGRVRALAGVSLEVPAGTLTHVAGPNGAGKSTLLRVLAALTRPTRGSVRVLGVDPFGARAAATRGRVGYLGPETGLYGELSVTENLAFCARLHGVPRARVERVVDELGLAPVADRRVGELSLGFGRRTGLARALLNEPDVLLLDEPWNGLDADAAAALAERLTALRGAGRTVLVAAHAVDRYADLFDRRVDLRDGAAVEA